MSMNNGREGLVLASMVLIGACLSIGFILMAILSAKGVL